MNKSKQKKLKIIKIDCSKKKKSRIFKKKKITILKYRRKKIEPNLGHTNSI